MSGADFTPGAANRDVYAGLGDLGVSGAHVGGAPMILGHRGAPREAPENTLISLRRAVEVGADGVEYDVRACGSGDLVLFHDERLERTSDGEGVLADLDLRELFNIDAGGWFGKRFSGEQIPILDEALTLSSEERSEPPFHMIELKERGLVERLARLLAEHRPPVPCRVASFARDVVLEAQDAGLPAMLLGVVATEDDRRFVRDERVAAYSVGPGGWKTEAAGADWSFTERWAWAVDDPDELLDLCREPLFGLNTNEPHRALVARALAKLSPGWRGRWPVQAPELYVEPEGLMDRARGEWFGRWETSIEVTNPMPFPVHCRAAVFVPHGAFEIEGLPAVFDLEPGESLDVSVRLAGGARTPGPDPLAGVLMSWNAGSVSGGEMRAGGKLLFDAPLARRRTITADRLARRLDMLVEGPMDPHASVTMRRVGGSLVLELEDPGGLEDAHLVARLGNQVVRGGAGLRLHLPARFDDLPLGAPFSCGIEGRDADGSLRLRRWSGGLPGGLGHGRPGLVLPFSRG